MATYVNDLRLKEIATGDESGTWGTSTNTNLELIAEAFSYSSVATFDSDADKTETIADGATDPYRSIYVKVTSGVSLTATRTLTIAPNTVSKIFMIENATSGSQSIAISQGSGANVTIPNGDVKVIYTDGAGAGAAVVDAFANLKVTDPAQTNITSVGALDGGSITSGFGSIDVGSSAITTTGTVTGATLAGTLSTAAQTNITSVGALNGGSISSGFGNIDIGSSNLTATGTISLGATSFNDQNITNVGDIALDSLSADGSSISIASPVVINGTTPSLTIGDAGAEDTKLVFDGNAQDFYIALDDSADDLLIGNGSTVGSNIAIGINASQVVKFNNAYTFPTSDGSANQVLQTNGSGALSFAASPTPTAISDADGDTKVQVEESADEDKIRFDTGGTERMRINASGQVSINDSTDPDNAAEFLQVRGTSNSVGPVAIRNASGDQSFYRMLHYYKKEETSPVGITSVDITGSSVDNVFLSDERLKDVLGSADGMNLISELNPIKFRFKDGTGAGSQGFTAQAFKQAFDNVGSYPRGVMVPDNADEYWYLDDKVLIPNLVKAIQELEARIATLEGS